ncbi:MAG: thiol peroxidase [Cyclobacteriaceae bacterium]|nr:thiol peroxidase [Cyclobacteriaceae bacterium]
MAQITLKGNPVHTTGNLPVIGSIAPDFRLTKSDLSDVSLSDFAGKRVILNIFPSIETSVCSAAVRNFNVKASQLNNTVVLCISKDLPFAHKRFCEAEGIENVITLSQYKDGNFSNSYNVEMVDGPFTGLMSRVVIALDTEAKVIYVEQVPEIGQEPNYEAAIKALS